MMAELLAALAGHPSSLFSSSSSNRSPSQLRVRDDIPNLHPAEVQILDKLATYSTRYVRIRTFAQAELDDARKRAIRSAVQSNTLSSNPSSRSRSAASKDAAATAAQPTAHIVPLCSTLLVLLRGYHELVLRIERDILANDAELVADRGFVSLASIRARLQEWDAPLSALDGLVDALVEGPFGPARPGFLPDGEHGEDHISRPQPLRASTAWTGGLLIDLLDRKATTGVKRVAECTKALRDAVEESWMVGLVAWVCYGLARPEGGVSAAPTRLSGRGPPVKDQLVQWFEPPNAQADASANDGQPLQGDDWQLNISTWKFQPHALPKSISEAAADSILYVGRALNTVRSSTTSLARGQTGKSGSNDALLPPEAMTSQHVALLHRKQSRPSQPSSLEQAIHEIRNDVSEWLFRNVLTTDLVLDTLETLGNYFLQREGTFTLSLLAEVETMRKNKLLHTRSAAAGAIRSNDLELALHRASVGTGAEDDPALDNLRFVMPPGAHVRPKASSLRGAAAPPRDDKGASRSALPSSPARFDDLLIGVPAQLHFSAAFPLDLFLSPSDLTSYSRLFSYLIALKRTQSRVLDCWMSLSESQRIRRRFTGTGEGGVDRSEERRRTELLRRSWGLTRQMLWFLDTLLGHFQTDVIDVQYTRLISQLIGHRAEAASIAAGSSSAVTGTSLYQSVSHGSLRRTSLRDRKDSGKSMHTRDGSAGPAAEGGSGAATPLASAAASVYAPSTSGNRTPRASVQGSGVLTAGAFASKRMIPFPGASGPASTVGGGGSIAPSHYRPHIRSFPGPGLPAHVPPTIRSYRSAAAHASATGDGDEAATLDFNSLRLTHAYFLTFLHDGLLLSSPSASNLIRIILETCDRFVGLVERWGGDVLPSLLSEGGLSTTTAASVQNIVAMRRKDVVEIEATLSQRLGQFFDLLNGASSSNSGSGTAEKKAGNEASTSAASASVAGGLPQAGDESLVRPPRVLPPSLLGKKDDKSKASGANGRGGSSSADEARMEADVAARRHLEQLLLRLDFNGRFSARTTSLEA